LTSLLEGINIFYKERLENIELGIKSKIEETDLLAGTKNLNQGNK